MVVITYALFLCVHQDFYPRVGYERDGRPRRTLFDVLLVELAADTFFVLLNQS